MNERLIIPILRIFDEAKAHEFYMDFLGFSVDFSHRFGDNFPIYMQVSRDSLVLHLSEHSGDCTPGSKTFINTKNLDQIYSELSEKNYKYNKPGIQDMPWGARNLELTDPFSNKIVFNEYKDS